MSYQLLQIVFTNILQDIYNNNKHSIEFSKLDNNSIIKYKNYDKSRDYSKSNRKYVKRRKRNIIPSNRKKKLCSEKVLAR